MVADENRAMVIRILDWAGSYELRPKEACGSSALKYVKWRCHGATETVPYRKLRQAAGPELLAALGLFGKLLEMAAGEPRSRRDGTVWNYRHEPASVPDIAFQVGADADTVQRCLDHLLAAEDWIECVPAVSCDAGSAGHAGIAGTAGFAENTRPNGTVRNGTELNPTEPNPTEPDDCARHGPVRNPGTETRSGPVPVPAGTEAGAMRSREEGRTVSGRTDASLVTRDSSLAPRNGDRPRTRPGAERVNGWRASLERGQPQGQAWDRRFAVELLNAVRAGASESQSQRRALLAIGRRIRDHPDRAAIGAELIEAAIAARQFVARAGSGNAWAVFQAKVEERLRFEPRGCGR